MKGTASTVANHLATAAKRGLPLHLKTLGITPELIEIVHGKIKENGRGCFFIKKNFFLAFWTFFDSAYF
jgi:hypothetical protein